MADALLTLSDVIADAQDLGEAEISDLQRSARFVAQLPAEEASDGTMHKYTKEVGAPTVGFRQINTGRDTSKSSDVLVEGSLEILDFSWKVDKALADKRRGRKGGREAFIAREGNRHRNSALFAYENQVINGKIGADALGFEGLADQASMATLAGAMVLDAGGTTVGGGSSIYAVRMGIDDVMGVFNGDTPVELGDTVIIEGQDVAGKGLPMYYTPGSTWLGLQVGGLRSVARIGNLTLQKTAGKFTNGLTDDLVAELITMFSSGKEPTHLVVSRQARFQLQQSRTPTNVTGQPAPLPVESHGVTLIPSDALSFTETLLA